MNIVRDSMITIRIYVFYSRQWDIRENMETFRSQLYIYFFCKEKSLHQSTPASASRCILLRHGTVWRKRMFHLFQNVVSADLNILISRVQIQGIFRNDFKKGLHEVLFVADTWLVKLPPNNTLHHISKHWLGACPPYCKFPHCVVARTDC